MLANPQEDLRKILSVAQLPAMPHSALSVLQLDNDLTKVEINDLVRPIEADPGLASQVLKFLNSSYFGFQNTISNVRQGISLVGIRVVKNFVLWKAVFSLIPKSKNNYFDVSLLWQDSLRRAMFARFMLMEQKQGDPEMAFAGALLQDMAIPVLMKVKQHEYNDFFSKMQKDPTARLSDFEKKNFGWTHADAAGILARNWKLPEALCNLVEVHTNANVFVDSVSKNPNGAAVALSAMFPKAVQETWPEKDAFLLLSEKLYPNSDKYLLSTIAKLEKEFEQYAAILQLSVPKITVMSYLQ